MLKTMFLIKYFESDMIRDGWLYKIEIVSLAYLKRNIEKVKRMETTDLMEIFRICFWVWICVEGNQRFLYISS